nr:MAG TPA: hypothetical protein [Caudoviricetes sp.]
MESTLYIRVCRKYYMQSTMAMQSNARLLSNSI